MPQSRRNKGRKEKLNEYKQVKQLEKQLKNHIIMERQQVPDQLKVRQVPKWKSDDLINITGLEWEAIYNALLSTRAAQIASDAVMQRAIADGIVQIDFEKLNEEGTDYVPMTDEEQKSYKEEFEKLRQILKDRLYPKKEVSPIVGLDGLPVES